MRGAVPPAAWAFAILLASDMLFLRLFPGSFAPFAFSQCAPFHAARLHRLVAQRRRRRQSRLWRQGVGEEEVVGEVGSPAARPAVGSRSQIV